MSVLPPHNIEAEQAVLGSLLIDAEMIYRVESVLSPTDFFRESHVSIYQAMLRLFARRAEVDILTLTDELSQAGHLKKVGGEGYLVGLITQTPTSVHAVHYARVVARLAARRRLIQAAGKIVEMATKSDYERLGQQAEAVIQEALQGRIRDDMLFGPEEWVKLLQDQLPILREQTNVLAWSTPTLDRVAPRLLPGSLVVIAARTGHGKSMLMLGEALDHARQGRPVLLATAENTVVQTLIRALSNVVRIDSAALFAGQWPDEVDQVVMASTEDMERWPLFLVGHPGMRRQGVMRGDRPVRATPSEVRRMALRMEREGNPPALIVVDYIQALGADMPTGNVRTDTIQVVWALKNLGLEFACPVITGAQVNRAVEGRGNKMPMPSDMKESGSIEEVADGLLILVDWSQYYAPGSVIEEADDRRVCRENEWMIYSPKDRWDKRSFAAGWLQTQLEYAEVRELARRHEVEAERRLRSAEYAARLYEPA